MKKYSKRIDNTIDYSLSSYYFPGYDREDLKQIGMLALLDTIEAFQEEYSNSFSTFFTHCLSAKYMTLLRNATRKKHQVLNSAVSIDQPIKEQEHLYLKDVIEDPQKNPAEILLVKEQNEHLYNTMNTYLSDFEKDIISLKLEGYSYQEIAEKLGCNTKQVDNCLYGLKKKVKKKYYIL